MKLAMKIKATLVPITDIKANRHQIQQDVKKLYDLTGQNQHSDWIPRPEEGVHSSPDYNTEECRLKMEIISTESSWLI